MDVVFIAADDRDSLPVGHGTLSSLFRHRDSPVLQTWVACRGWSGTGGLSKHNVHTMQGRWDEGQLRDVASNHPIVLINSTIAVTGLPARGTVCNQPQRRRVMLKSCWRQPC